jgi:hypothetical protein
MASSENDICYDAFLAHDHSDAEIVTIIADKLQKKAGLNVFLDKWCMIPGDQSFIPTLGKKMDESKTCVAFIGKEKPTGWHLEEINLALNRLISDKSFRLIPVLLPGAIPENVSDFLKLRPWVDFRKGFDDADAFRDLNSGIKGIEPGQVKKLETAIITPDMNHILQTRSRLLLAREWYKDGIIEREIYQEIQRKMTAPIFYSDNFVQVAAEKFVNVPRDG